MKKFVTALVAATFLLGGAVVIQAQETTSPAAPATAEQKPAKKHHKHKAKTHKAKAESATSETPAK